MVVEAPARARTGAGAAAGIFGTAVALLATGILHSLVTSFPFPPIAVAETIIHHTPGWLATWSIERLGHLAQPLLVFATTTTLLGAAAGLGRLLPRLTGKLPGGAVGAAFVLGLPLAAVAVAAEDPSAVNVGRGGYALALLPAVALGAWATAWSYRRLLAEAERSTDALDPSRREALRALWIAGAGLAVGWTGITRLLLHGSDPGGERLRVSVAEPAHPPSGTAAFGDLPGLAPRITPVSDFYVIDSELFDPDVNVDGWTLQVGGLVDRRFELTYDELLEQPAVEIYSTLECISNEVGGDLISTARWTGVPLRDLLRRAGVRDGALEVVSTSVDGYADSIALDEAMAEHTLVVIGMNGSTLPRAHGYPARLLVPGRYGMKQPKWLGAIEIVDRPFQGYWEERGWSKAAMVKTMSRLDTALTEGSDTVVAGVAFAGTRGISRVEVSADGGKTWADADLETPLSALTWRRWRFAFRPPDPDLRTVVVVRGTDGEGGVQTQEVTAPHPDGSSGYDRRTIG